MNNGNGILYEKRQSVCVYTRNANNEQCNEDNPEKCASQKLVKEMELFVSLSLPKNIR